VCTLICGPARAGCPTGDLDGDCFVGLTDLVVLAGQWLDGPCSGPACADLVGDDGVDLRDLQVLAENWHAAGLRLFINEYMSDNNSTVADPDRPDSYPDWFEIYNAGPTAVDLAGMFVSDGGAKWPIPAGSPDLTTIPPGGHLLFWADSDPEQGPLHVNFNLAKGGNEFLSLYDTDGTTLIDGVQTIALASNQSHGRLPDGAPAWQVFSKGTASPPTPDAANGDIDPRAGVAINEIMYNPYNADHPLREDIREEYVELHNTGSTAVDLTGWRLTDGVEYTFTPTAIQAGGYLVLAADPNTFAAKYPGVGPVFGPWHGRLSNSGERISLVAADGKVIDSVRYADQGDWAKRMLGPVDHQQRGWIWSDLHDGGGRSLELIQPHLPHDCGQNWAASLVEQGTPGTANSVAEPDLAPLILDVEHTPVIPQADDPVTVTARVIDEQTTGLTVTLHWRVDTSTYSQDVYPTFDPQTFMTIPMTADPQGALHATIPSQPDGTVVEFFVEARDAGQRLRTWPAPADVDGTDEQVVNALYQVDETFDPNAVWNAEDQPVYRIIMTEQERLRLRDIGDSRSGEEDSNAQMNATFISIDGSGMTCRYNVGVRNRGHGSRSGPPNNYRVNFRHDETWKHQQGINLNCRYVHLQLIGHWMFRWAGMVSADVRPVHVFVNGQDMAEGHSYMYGSYVQHEIINSDMAAHHWPDDPAGNLYKMLRDYRPADLGYRGDDPDAYRNSYFKQSNESQDDWQDVIELTRAFSVGTELPGYADRICRVAHIDEWLRWLALNSLLDNNETNLSSGYGDDFYMYRGMIDPRFVLIPYDLDTILGRSGSATSGIFDFTRIDALDRLLREPAFMSGYYRHLDDLIVNGPFNTDVMDPLFAQLLDFVTPGELAARRSFIEARGPYVQSLIPSTFSVTPPATQQAGYAYTTGNRLVLSGTADMRHTQTVRVNGWTAWWADLRNGRWTYDGGGGGADAQWLVPPGSDWLYLDDGSDQGKPADGTAWYGHPDYDDGFWKGPAPAELGYGDNDEVTVVSYGPDSRNKYITTYFRRAFDVDDPAAYSHVQLRVKRDDGIVVYLNGQLILRDNIDNSVPDDQIDYRTRAQTAQGGSEEDWRPTWIAVDPTLLQAGRNVIAVSVHQSSPTSSDISFDLQVRAFPTNQGDGMLLPGINRVVIQAFNDPNGAGPAVDQTTLDVWYDNGGGSTLAGPLTQDTTLQATDGPWIVTSDVIVDDGVTLTIEPGTSLFFQDGVRLLVNGTGRLVAEGTPFAMIRFTRVPDSTGLWGGILFTDSMQDNRITHAVLEYARSSDGMVGLVRSQLLLSDCHLAHTGTMTNKPLRRIETTESDLIVRRCVFEDMYPPGVSPLDNVSEHIWGHRIAPGGVLHVEGCTFGWTPGHNDAIDFDATSGVPWIHDNVFLGGGDDALDLETDALVENNRFTGYGVDQYNQASGHGNVLSAGAGKHYVMVRNTFDNCQHVAQIKDDSFLTFTCNTVSRIWEGALYFDLGLPGRSPGRGAALDGNIFRQADIFAGTLTDRELAVTRTLLHEGDAGLAERPDLVDGVTVADPLLVDPNNGNFALRPGSPAIGTGPWGLDRGGLVPGGIVVVSGPRALTRRPMATFTFGGCGIVVYRWQFDGGAWSQAIPIADPLVLADVPDGQHTLAVVGQNTAGVWQDENDAPTWSWTVQRSLSRVLLNELLARPLDGDVDFIELYNDSADPVNLAGMSLSDDPAQPRKFVFSAAATIPSDGYLVVYATQDAIAGAISTGFGLNADGGSLTLYDVAGLPVDSVRYGPQARGWTIGRIGPDRHWTLAAPTPGTANVAQQLGDPSAVRINEWLAASDVRYRDDWLELVNTDPLPISLAGFYMTDNPVVQPFKDPFDPLTFIAGYGYCVLRADGRNDPGHLDFNLSNDGEYIALVNADGRIVDRMIFLHQTADVSQGRVAPDSPTLAFFRVPTPGRVNTETIVINEVLAHSHAEAPDWIELYNASDATVDIGGWWISDDERVPDKYTIAPGTILEPGAYVVFTQQGHFGNPADPGCRLPFALSEGGDTVYLTAARDGEPTGYRVWEDFGASASGVSFGRYAISTGDVRFPAMAQPTPGAPNSGPRIGPVVITELFYNPGPGPDDQALEFIELMNISDQAIYLQNEAQQQLSADPLDVVSETIPWRMTDGVEYQFAPATELPLPAGGRLVLVHDVVAFTARFTDVPPDVPIVQWTAGGLNNSGESVELAIAGDQEWQQDRYWICLDRVNYGDDRPWPTAADGTGSSLTKLDPAAYGDDPAAWTAAPPSPGR